MADPRPANEHLLELPGGAVLAYAEAGNPASPDVVMFFHGVFGVGSIKRIAPIFEDNNAHFINPTLPGWGESSPVPADAAYHTYLYEAVTHLITSIHPDTEHLRLYLAGGSFGTVVAQILYGAPYDQFPLGRHIAGLLLLAPFSPPHAHKQFSQCLTWPNYLMIGTPARFVPFNLVARLGRWMLKSKVDTREHAEGFIREFAFTKMTPEEQEACERWKAAKGIEDGDEVKELADGVYRSVRNTWEGFMTVPSVFQSGWGGYSPADLDEQHSKPVLIVITHRDWETKKMGEWLGSQLKNAHVRYEEGGHVASMFVMDDIWSDFMTRVAAQAPSA
ncbi:hypothetical protein NM688_g7812 [Phlebia brevispora]|uniref:Uncharacterized protein n=1 Tax=Phlebia brevispora TaxID=194682 RepID=A0ACC1S1C8_9APHY|nr:hypothetical protein NM688_g7812 [Phlebia brevispora]